MQLVDSAKPLAQNETIVLRKTEQKIEVTDRNVKYVSSIKKRKKLEMKECKTEPYSE